jgi:hypothetical protein
MISSINSSTVSMTRPTETEMKQHRQEMFTQMDTNGDGSVDKAEFTEFGKQMAQQMKGPDRTEEMFAEMDTDGDGAISQAEFEAFEPPKPPEGGGMPPAMNATEETTSSDTLTTLLNSLSEEDDEESSSFRTMLQQYVDALNANQQSLVDLLG